MSKKNKIIPKSPKIMATVTLNSVEYVSLSTLFPEVSDSLENGIFFKNLDPVQPIKVKKSSVLNTSNELSIINDDEIFIQTTNFSDILVKATTVNPQEVSVIAN